MPIIKKKVDSYINSLSSNELTKEMFDENKNLDLNAVYNMSKSAVQKSGSFVYCGIMFNENDIDKLYTYIKGEN